VLALTGENGAGKSTLSKIIGGLVEPTTGTMQLGGDAYAPASRTQAEALGVRMVMQELNLPDADGRREPVSEPAAAALASSTARGCARCAGRDGAGGLDAIDPDTPVGALGIGHQPMVEIARNLIGDCRVLILDEPTAMLTAREVELLFEQIDRLKARGVAIVYISHRLEELRALPSGSRCCATASSCTSATWPRSAPTSSSR
jgi:ribose transport system ATP-binding protein